MLDLTQMSVMGDGVIAALNDLRGRERIVWHEPAKAWLALRHEDVAAGFRGEVPLSNQSTDARMLAAIDASEWTTRLPRMINYPPRWVLSKDGAQHRQLRSLLLKGFTRRVIENQRPFVQLTIERSLDAAATRGSVEFVEDIARAVTGAVIMKLIGIPESLLYRMKGWADAKVGAAETAFREMEEVFLIEIARRRHATRRRQRL